MSNACLDLPIDPLIRDRIAALRDEIPETVTLMAVTKKMPAERMRMAYDCGVRHFGESRIQEALPKQENLRAGLDDASDIVWHFIGTLQSNKAQKAIAHFDWIHSVNSLKLAQRLDRVAGENQRCPNLCLQVKLLPDPNKSGWEVDELLAALPILSQLQNVTIRGLMVIPPLGLSVDGLRGCFRDAADLFQTLKVQSQDYWPQFDQLSMGMSGDYQEAIAAGSTMVRLGRTIFGER